MPRIVGSSSIANWGNDRGKMRYAQVRNLGIKWELAPDVPAARTRQVGRRLPAGPLGSPPILVRMLEGSPPLPSVLGGRYERMNADHNE